MIRRRRCLFYRHAFGGLAVTGIALYCITSMLYLSQSSTEITWQLPFYLAGITADKEVIHLGLSAIGQRSFRQAWTMLKSIVYFQGRGDRETHYCAVYRNNPERTNCSHKKIRKFSPLHLHILTDIETKQYFENLFAKSRLRWTYWSFYSYEDNRRFVEDIPNYHPAGSFSTVKIRWPQIVPENVTKLIALDTDMLFNEDITKLWKLFDLFNSEQALGLEYQWVGNSSSFDPDENLPFPSTGINTGVVLWKMDTLRRMNWNQIWQTEAKSYIRNFNAINSDQTIINDVLKKKPSLFYHIPCEWNVQLADVGTEPFWCPVVWRNPDELECDRKTSQRSTARRPKPVRLVHYNNHPKAEKMASPSEILAHTALGLTTHELRRRYLNFYQAFERLQTSCLLL